VAALEKHRDPLKASAARTLGRDELQLFLQAYLENNGYFYQAAHSIGRSGQAINDHLKSDPVFRAQKAEADARLLEMFEMEADRRGREGVDKLVVSAGKILGTEKVFSDTLLMARLRKLDPSGYNNRQVQHQVSGTVGVLHAPMPHASSEDWEKDYAKRHAKNGTALPGPGADDQRPRARLPAKT
jgi:hypothetical protein